MVNKVLVAVTIVAVILGTIGIVKLTRDNAEESISSEAVSGESVSGEIITTMTFYSPNEVSEHASEEDCWVVVGDGIYDVTMFISIYPKGDELSERCGAKADDLFEDEDMDVLEQYEIGQLM